MTDSSVNNRQSKSRADRNDLRSAAFPQKNPTGWNPWPLAIIAFFAAAIAGFAVFIWLCSRHPDDLVARDYYEQELRYQERIDRMQNAQRDAAAAAVTYDAASRSILISLPHAAGNLSGRVELYRPSAVEQDRQFQLQPDASGRQRIDAANLSPGLWKVRVSWTVGKQDYFIDHKIVIGPTGSQGPEVRAGTARGLNGLPSGFAGLPS
jgi:nitrogen fixation protein FixH